MIDRNFLIKRIANIKIKKFYKKLFELVLFYDIEYTQNTNGIFFNITPLTDEIIIAIENVVISYEEIII